MGRHGGYFTGPYKKFRTEMADLVWEVIGEVTPFDGPIHVDVELYVKRPKTTKLNAPRADIDNYLKAVFDCMNDRLWVDDSQIIYVHASKAWAPEGEPGYFTVGVAPI